MARLWNQKEVGELLDPLNTFIPNSWSHESTPD
jgi:hypothetical protein